MVCNRCPATHELAFASAAVASGSQQGMSGSIQVAAHCPNCHQDWSVSLQPRLVHAHSNVLASLRSHGCSPLDLLPSLMAAQCGGCSAAASLRWATVLQSPLDLQSPLVQMCCSHCAAVTTVLQSPLFLPWFGSWCSLPISLCLQALHRPFAQGK